MGASTARKRGAARHTGRAMGALVGALALTASLAGAAGAAGPPTTTPAGPTGSLVFYLVLGASDSLGVQPSAASPHGQPTPRGYANDVVAAQAARGVALTMTQMGCPGETTGTMISGLDRCGLVGDSQLADAVAFLRAHQGNRGLVTVDLGFNDVRPCLRLGLVTSSCVTRRLATLDAQLTRILSELTAAAGPWVTIVGMNHFNPLVAASVGGMRDAVNAAVSSRALDRMNDTLSTVYARFGVAVADVTGAFDQGNRTPVTLAGVGTVPAEVARVCQYTWMCQPGPLGPNIHPNDAGYQAIADAIDAALPATWWPA